jgi:hypothetical protein
LGRQLEVRAQQPTIQSTSGLRIRRTRTGRPHYYVLRSKHKIADFTAGIGTVCQERKDDCLLPKWLLEKRQRGHCRAAARNTVRKHPRRVNPRSATTPSQSK